MNDSERIDLLERQVEQLCWALDEYTRHSAEASEANERLALDAAWGILEAWIPFGAAMVALWVIQHYLSPHFSAWVTIPLSIAAFAIIPAILISPIIRMRLADRAKMEKR